MKGTGTRATGAFGRALWACLAIAVFFAASSNSALARKAYVVTETDHSVSPINLATNAAESAFSLGTNHNPYGIAITPNGATAYVVVAGGGGTAPITLSNNTVGGAIGGLARAVAITPDGTKAYVASGNTVTPINTATNTAGTAITIDSVDTSTSATGIAITPDGSKAYVAASNGHDVTPIDLTTGTAGTGIAMGSESRGIAITPDGATVYVANSDIAKVTPISTATNTAGTPITVGAIPNSVAVAPDGKTAYVVNQTGSVTPIDTATNTAGTAITVGSDPEAIAITGDTAYVANAGDDDVSPIDLTTNTRGTDIPVGDGPRGIAIVPSQGPTAAFTSAPAAATTPSAFDGSGSTDPDGMVARYDWDFGDGTVVPNAGVTPTHTYASAGSFTVKLTVTDDGGCSTDFVFTGQTAECLASPAAEISNQVDVQAAAAPPTSGTTTTAPAPTGQRAAALKKCKKIKNALKRKKCKKKAGRLPI